MITLYSGNLQTTKQITVHICLVKQPSLCSAGCQTATHVNRRNPTVQAPTLSWAGSGVRFLSVEIVDFSLAVVATPWLGRVPFQYLKLKCKVYFKQQKHRKSIPFTNHSWFCKKKMHKRCLCYKRQVLPSLIMGLWKKRPHPWCINVSLVSKWLIDLPVLTFFSF